MSAAFLQTFISGLQDPICGVLRAFHAHEIQQVLDGAVVYQADRPVKAGCFNNTFEVQLERPFKGAGALDRLMADALKAQLPLHPIPGSARTFRIVCSLESKLTAVDARKKSDLERLIAQRTGLRVERAGADVEFWLYGRSEGRAYLMRRLSYDRVTEKQLQKGELRPELCWTLNFLAGVDARDVFLDPFAGSGAIPLARMRMGPCAKLYALDLDSEKAAQVKRRLGPRAIVRSLDVRHLSDAVPDGTITKVVTDPPWGYYDDADVPALYRDMLAALMQATAKKARMVVLSARTEEMDKALSVWPELIIEAVFRILVNGKKAGVYVLNR